MSQLIEARVYDGEMWCRASEVAVALAQTVLAEREACAKVAWDYGWRRVDEDAVQDAAVEISAAIRARGKA